MHTHPQASEQLGPRWGGDVYLAISRVSGPVLTFFSFYSFISWLRGGNLNEERVPEAICPGSPAAKNPMLGTRGPSFHLPGGDRRRDR